MIHSLLERKWSTSRWEYGYICDSWLILILQWRKRNMAPHVNWWAKAAFYGSCKVFSTLMPCQNHRLGIFHFFMTLLAVWFKCTIIYPDDCFLGTAQVFYVFDGSYIKDHAARSKCNLSVVNAALKACIVPNYSWRDKHCNHSAWGTCSSGQDSEHLMHSNFSRIHEYCPLVLPWWQWKLYIFMRRSHEKQSVEHAVLQCDGFSHHSRLKVNGKSWRWDAMQPCLPTVLSTIEAILTPLFKCMIHRLWLHPPVPLWSSSSRIRPWQS